MEWRGGAIGELRARLLGVCPPWRGECFYTSMAENFAGAHVVLCDPNRQRVQEARIKLDKVANVSDKERVRECRLSIGWWSPIPFFAHSPSPV